MGKAKGAPPPAYRDDPTLEDAVSLHTTKADDDVPDIGSAPPAYTDNERTVGLHQPPPNGYFLEEHVIKRVNNVDIVMDPRFDTDPVYAEDAVEEWARIRPAQMIQIVGTHTQTTKNGNKTEKQTVTDFDIKLRLTEYLLDSSGHAPWVKYRTVGDNEKTFRGTVFKKRGKPGAVSLEVGKPELNQWCHLYCASHASLKRFRLTREVSGLDQRILIDNIKSLIHNTNYLGHTNINFPIENRVTEAYSSNRINNWRMTNWICMIFYITMLWIFTWPYLYFSTKRWAVIKVDWPFSRMTENGERCFTTISEDQWFQIWSKAIEKAVLMKKQGTLTQLDLHAPAEEAFQSGLSGVDRAVGILGSGIRAFNEVNRQLGWGEDC